MRKTKVQIHTQNTYENMKISLTIEKIYLLFGGTNMGDSLKYEINNHVAYVSIDLIPYSPLNNDLYKKLALVMMEIDRNDDVNIAVISIGNDKIFDSKEKIKRIINFNGHRNINTPQTSSNTYDLIKKTTKPVLGAINGLAIGGVFELALACDFLICSDRAKFAFPEVNLAILPSGGGTQRLQQIVGQSKAKELLYFGTMIDAQKALEINLVNSVVPYEELLHTIRQLAEKLAEKQGKTVKLLKRTINLRS